MIAVNNLSVLFGNFELFNNIGFMINKGDRIGLVGKNGAGKSTLLKIINKQISPSSGSISMPNDLKIGYLPQQMPLSNKKISVLEETKTAFQEILNYKDELEDLHNKLEIITDFFNEDNLKLLDRQSYLINFLQLHSISNIEGDSIKVLKGLGFIDSDLLRNIDEFSGGWRMRIELAKILLQEPDLLLLDEPTNHLDIEAIEWLEEFLSNNKAALLLISHDRTFLDNVTKRTIEINLGKIYDYKVSYSQFKVLQQERLEQQRSAYENQQKMIADTEKFIERFRYKATKAVQVQSRIKQLDKLDILEIEDIDSSAIKFKFPSAPRSGDLVVECTDLTKNYDEKNILNKINLVIERGEKVAFVGRNGEGKTTLSKIIMGQTDFQGKLKIGHNINIGYFAQNQDELLDGELTVFETLDRVAVGDVRNKLREILGSFLFTNDDIDKKVKVLSGGEKSRLSLAKLLLEPYNLLLLDEPTNHLDLRSKDILKQALQKYDGTVIVVSHDRNFLDELVSKVYEFRDKKIRLHAGGIFDFLRARKITNISEIEKKDANKASREVIVNNDVSNAKQQYLEKKAFDREKRILQNKIDKAEIEIEKLETRINEINKELETLQVMEKIHALSSEYSVVKKKLDETMDLWGQYHTDFENLIK